MSYLTNRLPRRKEKRSATRRTRRAGKANGYVTARPANQGLTYLSIGLALLGNLVLLAVLGHLLPSAQAEAILRTPAQGRNAHPTPPSQAGPAVMAYDCAKPTF